MDDLKITPEAKLAHENKFLRERITNLEVFKKNFFVNHAELIKTHEKLALLEQQMALISVKDKIAGLPDPLDENANVVKDYNDNLLGFFEASYSAREYQDLVVSIFDSVESLGLDIAIQTSVQGETFNHSIGREENDENIQLINQYRKSDEVIESEDYVIYNFLHISLLAKGLPVTKKEKNRQIKDYLRIISIGANTRIEFLSKNSELETLQKNIYMIFQKTHQSFESMQDSIDNQIIQISEIFLALESNLKESLIKMEISEEYMKLYKLLMHDTKSELNLLLTSGLTVDEGFLKTIIKLEEAYAKKV